MGKFEELKDWGDNSDWVATNGAGNDGIKERKHCLDKVHFLLICRNEKQVI